MAIYNYKGLKVELEQTKSGRWNVMVNSYGTRQPFTRSTFKTYQDAVDFCNDNKMIIVKDKRDKVFVIKRGKNWYIQDAEMLTLYDKEPITSEWELKQYFIDNPNLQRINKSDMAGQTQFRWSQKSFQELLNDWNKEHGTNFSLSGAYGYWELWHDANRLEVGSFKELYKYFNMVKYKYPKTQISGRGKSKYMTKAQVEQSFKELFWNGNTEMQRDLPMQREQWSYYVDGLMKDGALSSSQAHNWGYPSWFKKYSSEISGIGDDQFPVQDKGWYTVIKNTSVAQDDVSPQPLPIKAGTFIWVLAPRKEDNPRIHTFKFAPDATKKYLIMDYMTIPGKHIRTGRTNTTQTNTNMNAPSKRRGFFQKHPGLKRAALVLSPTAQAAALTKKAMDAARHPGRTLKKAAGMAFHPLKTAKQLLKSRRGKIRGVQNSNPDNAII